VITYKRKPMALRRKVLKRLSSELKEAWDSGVSLVVLHGGGSYGHYAAAKEMQAHGALMESSVPTVSGAMRELNAEVVKRLSDEGLPAMVFPPSAICVYDCISGSVDCNFEAVVKCLEADHVPVLYGDILYSRGSCGPKIVSGDELSLKIAELVSADLVVFVLDVKGVLLGGRGAKRLLRKAKARELPSVVKRLANVGEIGYDVTGGIAKKLELIDLYFKKGLKSKVVLASGLVPGNLKRALLGESGFVGTVILPA